MKTSKLIHFTTAACLSFLAFSCNQKSDSSASEKLKEDSIKAAGDSIHPPTTKIPAFDGVVRTQEDLTRLAVDDSVSLEGKITKVADAGYPFTWMTMDVKGSPFDILVNHERDGGDVYAIDDKATGKSVQVFLTIVGTKHLHGLSNGKPEEGMYELTGTVTSVEEGGDEGGTMTITDDNGNGWDFAPDQDGFYGSYINKKITVKYSVDKEADLTRLKLLDK